MTTNTKHEFKPCKPLPVGEPVLVYFSGKPPQIKEFKRKDGTEIKPPETQIALGVADSNFPDHVGQFNKFIARSWIAPASADGKKQATKWYQTIEAMAGKEVADTFAFKEALLTKEGVEAIEDPEERERKAEKLIPPEQWKQLRGFYVAYFRAPGQNKETKQLNLAKDGGVYQDVKEIKHPKSLRWNVDQVKLWPPPEWAAQKQEGTQPAAGQQTPPKQEDKPAGLGLPTKPGGTGLPLMPEPPRREPPPPEESEAPTFKRNFGSVEDMIDEMRSLCEVHADFVKLKEDFLALKGVKKVGRLPEADVKHLLVLFWLEEHRRSGGVVSANIGATLIKVKKALHQLEPAEAITLLAAADHEADDDIPF